MKTLVISLTILLVPVFAAADDVGSVVSTDDICAVRPDLCGGSSKRRRHQKQKKSVSNDDFWKRDQHDGDAAPLDIDQPRRKPAAIKTTRPKLPPRHPISFSAYMSANHNHTAIGGRRADKQDAFQMPNRPVIYPTSENSGGVRESRPAADAE